MSLFNGYILSALAVLLVNTSLYGGIQMSSHYLELTRPDHAYLFGFIQADGHLYKDPKHPNKGKLKIELAARDLDILQKIQVLIRVKSSLTSRVRSTNFTAGSMVQTYSLSICDMRFRQELEALGVPVGKKSRKVGTPLEPYSEIDYLRGVIDGDGSLGITKKGVPFISLVTASESLKETYLSFVKRYTGHAKVSHRNKRDNIYNICVTNEKAKELVNILYYDGCLSLERKKGKAKEIREWSRPEDRPKANYIKKSWTREEDAVLMRLSNKEAAEELGRTRQSVNLRRWRLTGSINISGES
jgi:hypothetical protein